MGLKLSLIAGVDIAYIGRMARCAVVVMRYPDMDVVEERVILREVSYPYVPGYLYLREGPLMVETLRLLCCTPEVVLVDGQGIAHPRGFGLACYVGQKIDLTTIGCAKKRLVGDYQEPEIEKGSYSLLYYEGRPVGAVVRTRTGVKPLFVSPGHKIDLQDAIEIVLRSAIRYRLPEPLRMADKLSRAF